MDFVRFCEVIAFNVMITVLLFITSNSTYSTKMPVRILDSTHAYVMPGQKVRGRFTNRRVNYGRVQDS